MRILVFPGFSGSLRGYSPFLHPLTLCKDLQRIDDDIHLTVTVPKIGDRWDYDREDVVDWVQEVDPDRTEIVDIEALPSNIDGCVWFSDDVWEEFNQKNTDRFYDLVMTRRTLSTPIIRKLLKPKFDRYSIRTPIVYIPGVVRTKERERKQACNYYGEEETIGDLVSMCSEGCIFLMDAEKKRAMKMAQEYLSPQMVRRLRENSIVSNYGAVDCESLDGVYEEVTNSDRKPRMFFGGKFFGTKGFDEMVQVANRLGKQGYQSVFVTPEKRSVVSEQVDRLEKRPYCDYETNCNRDEFFEKMSDGDFFICFSEVESFGVSYLEMMAGGLIGIMKDSDWGRDVCFDGYPFLFDDIDEATEMCMKAIKMIENGKRDQVAGRQRDYVEQNYGMRKGHERILQYLKDIHEDDMKGFTYRGDMKDLVEDAYDNLETPFSFSDMCEEMKNVSETGREFGEVGDWISRFFIRKVILSCGFRDLCNQKEPIFVEK